MTHPNSSDTTTIVDENTKVMTTRFVRFDDETLLRFAQEIINHPQYNSVEARVLDLRQVDKPDVSFEATRTAFGIVGKHSKEKVAVVILSREEHVEGFERLYEVHADSAPYTMMITSNESDVMRTIDCGVSPEALLARVERHINEAHGTISTRTALPSVFRDVESHVDEVDHELGKIFKEIRRSFSEGSTFAATAGCHELLRRIVGVEEDSIQTGIAKLVDSGDLLGYLTPMVRLYAPALRRDSIGDDKHATTLLRLCTVLLIYKVVLPKWVETYLYDLPIDSMDDSD